MSERDRNGRRVSVPDPAFIDEVGKLSRQMANRLRLERELEHIDELIARRATLSPFAPIRVTPFGPSPVQEMIVDPTIQALVEHSDALRKQVMESMGVPQEMMGTWTRPEPEGLPVPQSVVEELESLYEPPDDGLEYETVARTATSRKKKAVKTKEDAPVYVWGLQSSKPRNGGHFITYEVQLHEDGTTSCNCPGWIFKKSTQDRGCKHTRVVEEEAKLFIKKHRAGESLPTVAPSEEQMVRLQKSKAGAATDTSIKFNRVVDLD